jgi:hypothetical protein
VRFKCNGTSTMERRRDCSRLGIGSAFSFPGTRLPTHYTHRTRLCQANNEATIGRRTRLSRHTERSFGVRAACCRFCPRPLAGGDRSFPICPSSLAGGDFRSGPGNQGQKAGCAGD